MATKYEKQIEKLLAHVKKLHALVEERTQQLQYWQGYSKKLREERSRLQKGMLGAVRQALGEVTERFNQLKEENKRLRAHAIHQTQLNELAQQNLRNQLQYAMMRIDELAAERKNWRVELQSRSQAIFAQEDRVRQFETQYHEQRKQLQQLEERLRDSEHQIAMQQEQWQELRTERDLLSTRLEETEAELLNTQKKLKATNSKRTKEAVESLASQQNSVEREMSTMRDLVAKLQKETDELRSEIQNNHETIDEQERFIALLKDGKPVNIKSVKRKKEEEKENKSENA